MDFQQVAKWRFLVVSELVILKFVEIGLCLVWYYLYLGC